MKTKEELNSLKDEFEVVNNKLAELSDEELEMVMGGCHICEVARQVIRGNWGNGEERKRRLRAAGYDYGLVANVVNMMLGYPKRHPSDCWLEG